MGTSSTACELNNECEPDKWESESEGTPYSMSPNKTTHAVGTVYNTLKTVITSMIV